MIDQVTTYAKAIVSKKILAGKKVMQACKRHLNDLEKSEQDDFPYYFDVRKSEAVIKFIGSLPNPDDGKPMTLINYQAFIIVLFFVVAYTL